jgi:hypothetical protein
MNLEFINWMADSIEACQDQAQLDFAQNLFQRVKTTPEQKLFLTEVVKSVEDRIRRQNGSVDNKSVAEE